MSVLISLGSLLSSTSLPIFILKLYQILMEVFTLR